MNISDVYAFTGRPDLYAPGTSFMWTDEYIGKQLMEVHLDPDVDLASRKESTIRRTVEWILGRTGTGPVDILDLGCGPGLYTERLAARGHRVTGVDISRVSIETARERALQRGLDISYINRDYLELEPIQSGYDLVMMIYTDFGVLPPEGRAKLLKRVHSSLKPGGLFIFDVLNDRDMSGKLPPPGWESAAKGFWREQPYLALSSSFFYEEEKVMLTRHIVADDVRGLETYHFWTRFFSHPDLKDILETGGFTGCTFHEDVLPYGTVWEGDNVTFCVARV